ncbi:MAG: insulinase family protein, partial [Pseudomonadota bacterium]
MLFLGTEKYPQPDDYAGFIQQHGGSNNAYTTFGNTNYFFEIESSQLEMALDRFAQFFIAPLFSEDLVQREKNAVHSEFTGKRREESLRFWSVRKEGFNPAHPFTGFTTGNLETLADRPDSDIRDELIEFYHTYYSSNIMSLAIAGRDSLDQLEQWAREKFSAIDNRQAQPQKFDIDLYTQDQLATRIDIKPLTDQRFLLMTFPIPKDPQHRFSRPRAYIGNVLGHEGKGSLLSELKRHGWVNGLSAGGSTATRNATSFDVSIGLTESGTRQIDDVVEAVFAAINRLRESGLPRWIFDENQMIDELSFRYQEKAAASSMARALSVRAQDWPPAKLLSGPYRRSHFDTSGIESILQRLTPDNMQLVVAKPDVMTDRTTQWYDAPYSIYPITEQALEQWRNAGVNPRIQLPQPNRFVPRDLALRADGSGDPLKLVDTPRLQVWHRTDSSFGVPRASFRANIHLPVALASPQNNVMTDIYARMVNEQLNEFSYAANLAGLGAGISVNSRGLGLRMGGYADGQVEMLQNVVNAMTGIARDQTLFRQLKRELQEEITNDTQNAPYKQTAARTYQLLYTPYYTDQQRLDALADITLDQLIDYADSLFNEVRIVALSH